MKERPILFSGEMVRAILEGRKTMTRRVIKPQPKWPTAPNPDICEIPKCPYGDPGDRLWVRETFRLPSDYDDATPEEIEAQIQPSMVRYLADGDIDLSGKNRPSIFMRRCWSRITLEVTAVRVERVQDISDDNAKAEGVGEFPYMVQGNSTPKFGEPMAIWHFRDLWNSINDNRGYGWDANPWVWVVEFKRVNP